MTLRIRVVGLTEIFADPMNLLMASATFVTRSRQSYRSRRISQRSLLLGLPAEIRGQIRLSIEKQQIREE